MAGNITVVGLGAGDMDQLTVGVHKLLTQAKHLYIRTKDHPLIPELEQETEADIRYFDDIYENMISLKRSMKRSRTFCLKKRSKRMSSTLFPGIRLSLRKPFSCYLNAGKNNR